MENNKIVIPKALIGGALLSAFLVLVMPVFAYDQDNTHPALTDEIVDFYNLNFPDKKITEKEKQLLIKGAIDEDTGERPLFHFYDPVYNRGVGIVHLSSKEWATKDGVQAAYYNSQFTGFAAISGGDSASDFSYQRALRDYAKGDNKRAFIAFGHTLHLLEDAGVPDHTRNDAHPSFIHGQESPYESEMAKWHPGNFNIARGLFLRREKPTSLVSMERYFDRIADYSNSNFFSKDTISNEIYSKPLVNNIKKLRIFNTENYFITGIDPTTSEEFPLAVLETRLDKGILTVLRKSLLNDDIKTHILDGYWERLSKEVVIGGAGALRLFLEEAEEAKREYLVKAEQKRPSFWAQVASLFGFGDNDGDELTTLDDLGTSDVNDDELSTSTTRRVGNPQGAGDGDNDGDSGDTSGDKKVSPSLSPVLSPSPSVSPKLSPSPVVLLNPTPSPVVSPLVSPNPSPIPKLFTTKKTGGVVINEIAWAGTSASANDEWIELYNAENYDIDISGWTLKAEDGTPDIIIEEGKVVKAQSYFLLERTDDTTVNSIAADQFYTGALGNAGEYLKLSDSSGIVVGIAGNSGESWPAGSSIGKYSMERTGGPDASVGVNWKNFTGNPSAKDANGNFINGTPKATNSTAVVTYSSGGGGGGGSSSPTPTPTPSPEPDGDTDGDTANSGDVTINEIAWMGSDIGGTANQNANAEWVELYNTTDKTIDLTDWTLAAQDGTPSITTSGSIGPFDYYLLERTSDNSVPGIVADQIYTGALGNGGEHLVLKDVSGTTIDQVDGSNEWKLNDDDEIIGDNDTKETAQKLGNSWITAESTPKAENQANSTTTAQAPSAVTDLSAAHNSPIVTATWTAPDPGTYAPASLSYDMRYSSTIFTEAASASWWSGATQVASSSLPSVGEEGASQSASFDVVHEYNQTLYFGLKTKVIHTCEMNDTACRSSGVSNLASASWPGALDSGAWGMFGKDQYHTSLANVSGPGTTATTSWTFDVAAEFGSDYAISQLVADSDGNIYFGAANGSSGKLIKLDKNAIKQWEYGTNVSIGTPAVLSDGTVYFGKINDGVVPVTAINSDGTEKWVYSNASRVEKITVSSKGEPHFAFQSGSQKKLVVLKPADGSVKTTISISGAGFAPVVLDDGTIITASNISGNQQFTAYSATGSQSWQVFSNPDTYGNAPADPSYDKATGKTYSAAGRTLFDIPLNPTDGSNPNSTIIASASYAAATTVAISSDTLYVGFNNTNPASGSLLYALNKSDLSAKWSFQADGLINKQLVIDNAGNVYFSTQNGKLYRVNTAGSGSVLVDSGSSSAISPVLTEHGLVWSYGGKVVVIE